MSLASLIATGTKVWLDGIEADEIDKEVDFIAIEGVLMAEGITIFVAPQRALLKLVAQKRRLSCLS